MIAKNKYDLIKSPIITEKSTILGEFGKYVFEVSPRANKSSVKKAIEEIFGTKNPRDFLYKNRIFKHSRGWP